MLPELHAVKVLFYADSVGVVTSGHVTKMEITPLASCLINAWPLRSTQNKITFHFVVDRLGAFL